MRYVLFIPLAFLVAVSNASPSLFSPYYPPLLEQETLETNDSAPAQELYRRQGGCAAGYSSCYALGAPGSCCSPRSLCQIDQAGHVACCPEGQACTGTIGVASASASASTQATNAGIIVGGAAPPITSTTNTFAVPATTGQTVAGSVVSNQYFAFAAIPTSYPNAAACSSYYSGCQSEFARCTSSVGVGVNGVTVSGPGAGITVQGASVMPQATSICSSLSSAACHGLQLASCSGGTAAVNLNAAPTKCSGLYGFGAGVIIGVAGQVFG
ncbi:MAG: hypothetical protein M1835_007623 [Candelina submexicana]|nr:MAG: hypothetical protein M1835_007623 [Candelina submexicana]